MTTITGETDGVKSGSNLFFSFSKFNLPANTDEARFVCSGANCGAGSIVDNVIARVNFDGTNGASTINGIVSFGNQLTNANFWLFNPEGVVIGAGASINVPGSFHVGNATQVSFSSSEFSLATTDVSSLSIAPTGFGFTSVDPDGAGVKSSVSPSGSVSLSGGAINTASGSVDIQGSQVLLNGSTVTAGGAGTISISGTNLLIQDGSTTTLTGGGATLVSSSGAIQIGSDTNLQADSVTAGTSLSNAGTLNGSATAGTDLTNTGDISGNASAGTVLTNSGTINGNATGGTSAVGVAGLSADGNGKIYTVVNQFGGTLGNADGDTVSSQNGTDIQNFGVTGGAVTAARYLDNSGTIGGLARANNG
ncbi:hypothetical protein, partial [Methylomonas koyamae]|uniref:two-partner secretion domain-containing protein n=1 Tax=Methylomonas koyamae TaxID=702114 RepID=UPI0018D422AB